MDQPPAAAAGLRDALVRETERICVSHEIALALKQLLLFEPWLAINEPILHSRVPLMLTFRKQDWPNERKPNISKVISAFSTIVAHSFHLNKLPTLKVGFWRRIFESDMLIQRHDSATLDVDKWIWIVEDERFPVVTFEMSQSEPMNQTLVDALFAFFTTPPGHNMDDEFRVQSEHLAESPSQIGVTLRFDGCKLKPKTLRLVEQLLDRVFASPTRQYGVRALYLTNQEMSAAYYEVLVDILKKSHAVYQVQDGNVSQASGHRKSQQVSAWQQKLIAAACNSSLMHGSPVEHPRAFGRLRALTLGLDKLGLQHIAALCSALRYDCSIETVCLTSAFSGGGPAIDEADRAQCWRWLAYGMFYPRSKKLTGGNQFRALHLSGNPFHFGEASAFRKALSDPVSELIYQGKCVEEPVIDELLLCTIKHGATFCPHATGELYAIHRLERQMELEAICQQDGWTCAVLPGIGFGWVENSQILSKKLERIDTASHRSSASIKWTFEQAYLGSNTLEQLNATLAYIGEYVSFIGIEEIVRVRSLLAAILSHCSNLKHICLRGSDLADHEVDALMDALNGDIGGHLLSLDLDGNRLSHVSIEKLSSFLSNPVRVPALLELRVSLNQLCHQAYTSLRCALEANKTLRILKVQEPDPTAEGADDRYARSMAEHKRIQENHQGELLPAVLPLNQKLAFLSAIQHESVTGSARHGLDSFMVTSIFQFAADAIRRRILWDDCLSQ